MAWYSLYLWFSQFSKRPYTNMISWYKNELHEQWFNSLSEEDQRKVLAYRETQKRKRQMYARQLLLAMETACIIANDNKSLDTVKKMEDILL